MIILLQLLGIVIGMVLMMLPFVGLALYSLIEDKATAVQKALSIIGFCLVWFAQFFGAVYFWNLIG